MTDFVWFFVGLGFGIVLMLNRKEYRDRENYEQVDERIRKELALNKNLVESLKKDLAWTKQTIATLKGKK
jgi:hypothetical protein